jgi:hypothetical protein
MLVHEELQKKISDFLAVLEVSVRNRVLIGLLDQNLVAQPFIAKLLNIVYGYDLINLDTPQRKRPAIDLGDSYRKIAFQVTSTEKTEKIRETINTFIRKKEYDSFKYLKFIILGSKKKNYPKDLQTLDLFEFEPEKDILDLKDIIRKLPSLSLDKLQRLSYLIDSESLLTEFFKTTYQILHGSNDGNDLPIEEVKPDNVARTVHCINVSLYSDPGCQNLRPDMKGIILENRQQPENVFAGYTIHPTTSTSFKKGTRVICLYSRNSICEESWYQHPETGETAYAWGGSMELIGRTIDDS